MRGYQDHQITDPGGKKSTPHEVGKFRVRDEHRADTMKRYSSTMGNLLGAGKESLGLRGLPLGA